MPPNPNDLVQAGIRCTFTIGGALVFAGLVVALCLDVWVGDDTVSPTRLHEPVMVGLSLTFGSAFVGWFGLGDAPGYPGRGTGGRLRQLLRWLFGSLAGAALFAMIIYLGAGFFAAVTYFGNEDATPTALITIAAAWAAQGSAVIGSTLAKALKP